MNTAIAFLPAPAAHLPLSSSEALKSRSLHGNLALRIQREASYRELTDLELVELARGEHKDAFGEIIRRYRSKVMGLALKITKNEIDAQEVVQDVFLNAFAKLESFKGTAAFSSWLYRVAANGALMLLRGRRRDASESWEDLLPHQEKSCHASMISVEWSSQADRILERKQIVEALERELQAIPKRYRTILILREIDGLSNQEIADILHLSVAAVKSRLHRARLTLRLRLHESLLEG